MAMRNPNERDHGLETLSVFGSSQELGDGVLARFTCGCAMIRDFDGREYEQSLMCPGGAEHGRGIENPTRENAHLWRPRLPFDEVIDR
jgi:hypothetical protein